MDTCKYYSENVSQRISAFLYIQPLDFSERDFSVPAKINPLETRCLSLASLFDWLSRSAANAQFKYLRASLSLSPSMAQPSRMQASHVILKDENIVHKLHLFVQTRSSPPICVYWVKGGNSQCCIIPRTFSLGTGGISWFKFGIVDGPSFLSCLYLSFETHI